MTAIAKKPSRVGGFFSSLGNGTVKVLDALSEAQLVRDTGPAPLSIEADTVDQLLRLARLERGMSLEQLSQLTSISTWRLERYESSDVFLNRPPSTDELVRIKTVLNLSTESVARFI